jgi:hypothetical protein
MPFSWWPRERTRLTCSTGGDVVADIGCRKDRSSDLGESVLIPSMDQYQVLSLCVPCVTPMKCVLWGHGKTALRM